MGINGLHPLTSDKEKSPKRIEVEETSMDVQPG